MTRYGEKISNAPLKHPKEFPNSGIQFSNLYEEWEACTECGLDLEKWITGYYSIKFMAQVIAFFRLKKLKELHLADSSIKKSRK